MKVDLPGMYMYVEWMIYVIITFNSSRLRIPRLRARIRSLAMVTYY